MKSETQTWNTILTAIRETQPFEASCDELSDELLAVFAEWELTQDEPTGKLLRVEQHLRHCPTCRELVEEIVASLRLLQQESADFLRLPAVSFDLSFLPVPAPQTAMPARVRTAFQEGAAWMLEQQTTLWINLAAPSGSEAAFVTKGAEAPQAADDPAIYQVVVGADATGDLDVEVIAKREADPHVCTLTVKAIVPSRWPQVGGIDVELYSNSFIQQTQTGKDGQAIFSSIPVLELPVMAVRVTP